jgi:hypothetical protein
VIGDFVVLKFSTTGGMPVWDQRNLGRHLDPKILDLVSDRELCLVMCRETRLSQCADEHVLFVLTPRGACGWIDEDYVRTLLM